jgi:Tol biopolymer transport system component/DNA-binding winged helix-turn-helix (wHTH) protein
VSRPTHDAGAAPGAPHARLRVGDLEIDTAAGLLRRDGEIVRLEPRIYQLFLYLLENRGRLVTKDELFEHVWGGAFVTENALDRAVARLRKALGDDVRAPRYVETAPTRGYRFVAEVEEAAAGGPVESGVTDPSRPEHSALEAPGRSSAPSTAASATPRAARRFYDSGSGGLRSGRLGRIVAGGALAAGAGLLALLALARNPSADRPAESEPWPAPDRMVARQLTFDPAFEFGPSFSPDGAVVAYTSTRSGDTSIWLRSLAAGGRDSELAETGGARSASWSPDGRWIAYDSYRGIWIVPPTGGTPRQLVAKGGSPRWSPDATTIVYQGSVEGVDINSAAARPPSTLWTVRVDGEAPRQLTAQDQPPGGHGHPAFSPDGRHVAFVTAAFGQGGELWTISIEGGDLRRVLARCQCRDPAFSHDGGLIYYGDYVDSHHGLWVVDASGSAPPRRLYEAPLRFFSPAADGRRIAASRHELRSELWSVRVDPATGAPIGDPEAFSTAHVERNQFPVPSPDGERLAFVVTRAGNVRELWTMSVGVGGAPELLAAGGLGGWPGWSDDSRQIYFVESDALRRVDVATRRVETVVRTDVPWQTPAVAPGGEVVAFSLVDTQGVSNVWTLDSTGEQRQITFAPHDVAYPTWSPDGRLIAIEVDDPRPGTPLAYVSAEGGEIVELTEGPEQFFTGGWSPDGDKVLFVSRPAETPEERWDVGWVSRSTREVRRITARPPYLGREFVRYPAWAARGDRVFFELAQSNADLWIFELPPAP